jgi:hypothetical protein
VARFSLEAEKHDVRQKRAAANRPPNITDWSNKWPVLLPEEAPVGLGPESILPQGRWKRIKVFYPATEETEAVAAQLPRFPPLPSLRKPRELTTNPVNNFNGDGSVTRQRRGAAGDCDDAYDDDDGYASGGDGALPRARVPNRTTKASLRFTERRPVDQAAFINAQPGCNARHADQLEALQQYYTAAVKEHLEQQHSCRRFGVTTEDLTVTWKLVRVVTLIGSFDMDWPVSMECPAAGCSCNGALSGATALNPLHVDLFPCNPTWDGVRGACNTLFCTRLLDLGRELTTGVAEVSFHSASLLNDAASLLVDGPQRVMLASFLTHLHFLSSPPMPELGQSLRNATGAAFNNDQFRAAFHAYHRCAQRRPARVDHLRGGLAVFDLQP